MPVRRHVPLHHATTSASTATSPAAVQRRPGKEPACYAWQASPSQASPTTIVRGCIAADLHQHSSVSPGTAACTGSPPTWCNVQKMEARRLELLQMDVASNPLLVTEWVVLLACRVAVAAKVPRGDADADAHAQAQAQAEAQAQADTAARVRGGACGAVRPARRNNVRSRTPRRLSCVPPSSLRGSTACTEISSIRRSRNSISAEDDDAAAVGVDAAERAEGAEGAAAADVELEGIVLASANRKLKAGIITPEEHAYILDVHDRSKQLADADCNATGTAGSAPATATATLTAPLTTTATASTSARAYAGAADGDAAVLPHPSQSQHFDARLAADQHSRDRLSGTTSPFAGVGDRHGNLPPPLPNSSVRNSFSFLSKGRFFAVSPRTRRRGLSMGPKGKEPWMDGPL